MNLLAMHFIIFFFFFSSRRRHTRFSRDWSSDVCSSDLDSEHIEIILTVCPAEFLHNPISPTESSIPNPSPPKPNAATKILRTNLKPRSEERRVGKECR